MPGQNQTLPCPAIATQSRRAGRLSHLRARQATPLQCPGSPPTGASSSIASRIRRERGPQLLQRPAVCGQLLHTRTLTGSRLSTRKRARQPVAEQRLPVLDPEFAAGEHGLSPEPEFELGHQPPAHVAGASNVPLLRLEAAHQGQKAHARKTAR